MWQKACHWINSLTHWNLNKMADILQTTFCKYILLNKSVWSSIEFSLMFVAAALIDSKSVPVKIIACYLTGDNQKPDPNIHVVLWRIYASPGLNKFTASVWARYSWVFRLHQYIRPFTVNVEIKRNGLDLSMCFLSKQGFSNGNGSMSVRRRDVILSITFSSAVFINALRPIDTK